MAERHSTTVAIIGAGAGGTLAAIQLLRRAESADTLVDLRLIDPAPTTGRGVAYGTVHAAHLLNVRAARMGAAPPSRNTSVDGSKEPRGGATPKRSCLGAGSESTSAKPSPRR